MVLYQVSVVPLPPLIGCSRKCLTCRSEFGLLACQPVYNRWLRLYTIVSVVYCILIPFKHSNVEGVIWQRIVDSFPLIGLSFWYEKIDTGSRGFHSNFKFCIPFCNCPLSCWRSIIQYKFVWISYEVNCNFSFTLYVLDWNKIKTVTLFCSSLVKILPHALGANLWAKHLPVMIQHATFYVFFLMYVSLFLCNMIMDN